MRQPLRSKRFTRRATSQSLPAPVGGWNARDSLAQMSPTDAIQLDNWFPSESSVDTRGGCSSHATGATGTIKTLAVYNEMDGTSSMYGYTASGIYDVSSAGAVGASKLARTNGKHQWTMFGDGSSNWLIAVNGVDAPAYYDGSAWTAVTGVTTPALTGLTTTNIIGVCVFKGRLIFIEKDSLSFWYLAAGAAGGALTEFDLSGEAPKGGYLMACGTWTRDAGSGPDDFFVAITSEGEAIVYQGTDPSSSTTWAKVGSYTTGKPLGRRCLIQYGPELVVLVEQGIFRLSSLLSSGDERAEKALTWKIHGEHVSAARDYGTVFGWKAIAFPRRNALLINVPRAEDGVHVQHVMNMTTRQWCRFTGWDAEDFAVYNGDLYFSDGTAVYKAWDGTSDNNSNITYTSRHAFQRFGSSSVKTPKMWMPIMEVTGVVTYSIGIDVDFLNESYTSTVTSGSSAGSAWGTAIWGSFTWGSDGAIVREWTGVIARDGTWISPKITTASNSVSVKWMGSTLLYEEGIGI